MSLTLSFEELAAYSQGEWNKWWDWFETHPAEVLDLPVQSQGRHGTVWGLLEHIAVVEARHIQRIRRELPLITESGAARNDLAALRRFTEETRRRLLDTVHNTPEPELLAVRDFEVVAGMHRLTPRKLLFHILLHEIRHMAQIATAVRNGGHPPPPELDLFFSRAVL